MMCLLINIIHQYAMSDIFIRQHLKLNSSTFQNASQYIFNWFCGKTFSI